MTGERGRTRVATERDRRPPERRSAGRLPARRAVASILLLVLAGAACGQKPGVHRWDLAASEGWAPEGADAGPPVGDGGAVAPGAASITGGAQARQPGSATGAVPAASPGAPRAGQDGQSTGPQAAAPVSPGRQAPPPRQTTRDGRPRRGGPIVIPAPLRGGGPLRMCPVQGPFKVWDDWGAPRYSGGYHPHAGNDIFAPAGTPIVAPFDGLAVDASNTLGGRSVKVYGPHGYVYNAHLSAFGQLGYVRVGTVVGYVGNTGNAVSTPPHNHFEWHPGNGAAVNPFPYLVLACS